jgi:hypothetical protein
MPDDSDLKPKSPFANLFGGAKKKENPAPEPEKKKNWWTL